MLFGACIGLLDVPVHVQTYIGGLVVCGSAHNHGRKKAARRSIFLMVNRSRELLPLYMGLLVSRVFRSFGISIGGVQNLTVNIVETHAS
jgi:hypothetical protein